MASPDAQYIVSKLTAPPFSMKMDVLLALIGRVLERLTPSTFNYQHIASLPIQSQAESIATVLATLKYPHHLSQPTRDALIHILSWLFREEDAHPGTLATRAFVGDHLTTPPIPDAFLSYGDVAAAADDLQAVQREFVQLHQRVEALKAMSDTDALKQEQQSLEQQQERLEEKLHAVQAKVLELPDLTPELRNTAAALAAERLRATTLQREADTQRAALSAAREQAALLAQGVQEAAHVTGAGVAVALGAAVEEERGGLLGRLEGALVKKKQGVTAQLEALNKLLALDGPALAADATRHRANAAQLRADCEALQQRAAPAPAPRADEAALAQARAAAAAADKAREEALLKAERLDAKRASLYQDLQASMKAASHAALHAATTQLESHAADALQRCHAAEAELQQALQHTAQLEEAMQQLRSSGPPPTPTHAPVSPRAVEALLKQSRALRVRVQELEAERTAAKKKHDAAVLLWEGRTSGLAAEVDALSRQAQALGSTRDELQSQLAVAQEQALRVQDAEEFAALQARLQERVAVCDAAVRRLQEQLSLMNQVDEDVQQQYAMARALETMLQAKLAWLRGGANGDVLAV